MNDRDEFMLGFPDIKGREVYSLPCSADLVLKTLIEFFWSSQDLDLISSYIDSWGKLVELRRGSCQCWSSWRALKGCWRCKGRVEPALWP